jgi:hypothetical protein
MIDPYISMMYELTEKNHQSAVEKFRIATSQEEVIAIDTERYQKIRAETEPLVFAHLQEKYGKMLSDFWVSYTPPSIAKQAFVLVERRAHPNMWFILRNMAWCGPDLAVFIFCSDENYNAFKALIGDKVGFHLIKYFSGNPKERKDAIKDFNNFYTDYRVYEQIASLSGAEYIITVQMDNFFRRKIHSDMFVGDYYGSCWTWNFELAGGGGLTCRRVPAMIEICKKHRPDPSIDAECEGEDEWISTRIKNDGYNVPDIYFRLAVFMERGMIIMNNEIKGFVINPLGVHQSWSYAYEKFNREEYFFVWNELLTLKWD